MSTITRRFGSLVSVVALSVVVTAGAATASSTLGGSCKRAITFNPDHFHDPTNIDNQFLPLVPGTQFVYDGFITPMGGPAQPQDHQVIFTVTDLTKIVDGVRCRVVLDIDVDQGEIAESELSFWAQDDDGNVWNLGEYPEQYDNGQFVGADSTWIGDQAGAMGGIQMFATPQAGTPSYLQGRAVKIGFLDCAQVIGHVMNINGYSDVLQTDEWSPLDKEGGLQVKYYAPGVGTVQVGAIGDPEAETLVLTHLITLNDHDMKKIRATALKEDARGYQNVTVYRSTSRAVRDGDN